MKVQELAAQAGLKTFNSPGDREIKGVYISDMVSDIIGIGEGLLLVTLQTHKNLIAAANLVDVSGIVFARGKAPAEDVVALADKAGISLLGFPSDTWTLAKKLYEMGIR
ncbi:MAG: serine kinase [Candidatus Aminicenantes bacterium]|nr:serine kinase [Candidatus Aminicenantes bacterium]